MLETSAASMPGNSVAAVSRESARLLALERLDMLDAPKDEAFERVIRLIKAIFEVEIGIVSLIDAHRQWYQACVGFDIDEVPRDATFCRIVVEQEEVMIVEDATQDARFSDHPAVTGEAHVRFYAGMPLKTKDGFTIGTICAIDRQPRGFTGRELGILKEIADAVMDRIELLQFAATDGLTGAMTRRAFRNEAAQHVTDALRVNGDISVITLDVDHFKRINDTFGHPAGDQVLKTIAAISRRVLGPDALFGRLGGEEFAVALPGMDQADAVVVAEKLRAAFAEKAVAIENAFIKVTASFGVASLTNVREDIETLLAQADAAMYRAKQTGRNRCVTWDAVRPPRPSARRRRVVRAGTLVFGEGVLAMPCTIRTLGDDGAGLHLSDTAEVPDTFTLVIEGEGREVRCKVTTRDRQRVDVAFVAAA
ncbi:diguanylate cyclase with GAF sensor [Neorhizobium alkalisoli]|uniref:diguanylate cyclase n=2 Tax=Neorhizobium alkalisoli TaxID=528178 RepID=A0A561R2M8_9HYPH|nr:diguanylate cyclase with GAF sensor [Neorhizobium alkalisoli]